MTPHADTPFVLGDRPSPAHRGDPGPEPRDVFERNLRALARGNPELASRLRHAAPRADADFVLASDGAWSCSVEGRALASRRRPLEEASRLIETVDVREAAVFAVLGFGLGHHLEALSRKLGRTGVILCFEPDLALLRAVFERVDHSGWMERANIAFVTDCDDAATVSSLMQGVEGLVAMGVRIVEHPPSALRLGEASAAFGQTLTGVVSAIRTNVLTTLVQTETTVRNLLMNADRYLCAPGIGDLAGVYAGRPAVVVSAGPSLARNIDALSPGWVRERCCIVAVQTALKPLLAAGVRPHFVVALDHHEISRRFYEGLTPADVEGVTLVAEPKANPAILESWPGALRMPADQFLDAALGPELADPRRGAIRSGATVAHLAYYLARHLGCDPVALVGQDLGFTDHQYYAAGAAIHSVWAGELNEFVSLELLEWQRIARHKGILRKAEDHAGRAIYTDEQMATYLAQFERDFLADARAGLRVVDATEGGVRKTNTTPATLAAFLRERVEGRAPLPGAPSPSPARPVRLAVGDAVERIRVVRQGAWNVARICRQTETLLTQMSEHLEDQPRVNRLIAQTEQLAKEIAGVQPAYGLAQRFNQMGVFNRSRDDRAIMLDDLTPHERQRRQIERDIRNVRWLCEASERFGAILDAAGNALRGGEKVTRDLSAPTRTEPSRTNAKSASGVGALLLADTQFGALGSSRSLGAAIGPSTALRLTVERLARCERLDSITVLTDAPDAVGALLEGVRAPCPVRVRGVPMAGVRESMRAVRAGRMWARDCWRSGLAGLSVFDEAADPALFAGALEAAGLHAALVVGADWCFVDPELCDRVIARHEESPQDHRLVFTQASPGLCGCVIDGALLREIAQKRTPGAVHASIGALLAYNPRKARQDPIGKPICVFVEPSVRDAQRRFLADDPASAAWMGSIADALAARGDDPRLASAEDIVGLARTLGDRPEHTHTLALLLDDSTSEAAVGGAVRERAIRGVTLGVTLDARGMRDLSRLAALAAAARDAGADALHVRADLRDGPVAARGAIAASPEVLSVEMHADSAAVYRAVTGEDRFASALGALETLATESRPGPWARLPWIVPRMTKRDATHGDLESFVDKWTLVFGHASVDPHDGATPDQRVRPLPAPATARERLDRTIRTVDLRGRGVA